MKDEEKKVIIALYGDQNTGKSTTLRHLIERLGGKEKGDDPVAINDYNHGGKRIVVAPAGDNGEVVRKNIDFFKEVKGDILVIATRERYNYQEEEKCSAKALEGYAEELHTMPIWIHSSDANLSEKHQKYQTLIDEGLAKTIQSVIDQIITDWEKE